LLLAAQIFLSSAAARAESINANLCQASSRDAAERTLSSAATRELVKYLEGLKTGSYVFNWTISGHNAAEQLGFGRRFAASYSQAVEEVQARLASKRRVHIDDIIEYFSRILREEQAVDRLVGDQDRLPAVFYLRALQEGTCSFPYVLRDTPTAQAMMHQLALAHPEIKKRSVSDPFASIYNATVAYGSNQIKQNGSVSIYRLIDQMRRAIVQSANSNVGLGPSVSSAPPSIRPSVPQGKTSETRASGSGFFVTEAGHLLTNAHVVDDCRTIYVKSSDGQTGVAQITAADQNDDLALLRVERRSSKLTATFRTGRPTRAGESAVVFGFPLLELLASTGNVTTGIVTALAGLHDDPHQIQISAPVQPGSSDGPVLDASGLLIGVVVSRLNAALGQVSQNVNFAIKSSTAANFLDAHGVVYQSATSEKALSIPDIVEQAKSFSAQVLCHG
jgi:S1-C subfamily serine protease